MKGKIIFSLGCAAIFLYSVFVYINKGDSKIVVQELIDTPKLELNQFEYFRVKNDVVTMRIVGQKGMLMEGGLIQLRDGFRAVRYKLDQGEQRDELTARSADVEVPPNQLAESSTELTIKKAKIIGDVNLNSADRRFETEEAFYFGDEQVISSAVATKLQQRNQYLTSEKGFTYNIALETLQMLGPVQGVIMPENWKKQAKSGGSR